MNKFWGLAVLLLVISNEIFAQDTLKIISENYPPNSISINDSTLITYERPKGLTFLKNIPSDWGQMGRKTFSKKGLITVSAIAASTVLLMTIDKPAMNAVHWFGNQIGIDGTRKFHTAIGFNLGGTQVNMLDLPQNFNSTLYFIGEGWPSIFLTAGVLTKGLITNDNRAILTASQFAECYLSMGITIQFLKRITGRESPFVATSNTGKWDLFPNPSKYQHNVPRHDAFPSGHLATAMATVTIYSENYPELKFIKPVGYSMVGLIGLAMMNNGVHWLSDYPLALAVGYTYGKIATSRNKTITFIKKMGPEKDKGRLVIHPAITGNNTLGVGMNLFL